MSPLIDPPTRAKLLEALSQWDVGNGIMFTLKASSDLKEHLPRVTQERLIEIVQRCAMKEPPQRVYVVTEERPQWAEHDYYIKVLPMIGGCEIFIEIRLVEDSKVNPAQVLVVSIHP